MRGFFDMGDIIRKLILFLAALLLGTATAPVVNAAGADDRDDALVLLEKLTDDAEARALRLILGGGTYAKKHLDKCLRDMCSQAHTVRDLYHDRAVDDDPVEPALKIEEGMQKLRERWERMDREHRHAKADVPGKPALDRRGIDWRSGIRKLNIRATKSSRFSVKKSAASCRKIRDKYEKFLDDLQDRNLKTVQKIRDSQLRGRTEQIIMDLTLLRKRIWNLKCAE